MLLINDIMAFRNLFKVITRTQIILPKRFFALHDFKFTNNILINTVPKINKNTYRKYVSDEADNNELDQIVLEEIDDPVDKILIRNLLYANSKDSLILQLNECASVQNVFNIIRENHQNMGPMHISQAVLVLWDLQKIFYKYNTYYETDNSSNTLLRANAIIQNYMNQVNSHQDFEILIKLIEENCKKFSLDALTCTLLYLNRMGVKLNTNVMQLMIRRCEEEIKNCDIDTFPMTSLSRFIVTVYSQDSLYPVLVSVNSMRIIHRRLETCQTEEDFKLLTICLHKMKQLVSMETVENYKKLCETLLENNTITSNNSRTIIKAIRFLNQQQWFEYTTECTKKCMHILKGSLQQLTATELVSLFKVFQIQKEPADMLEEIQTYATKYLSESDINFELSLELLSCVVSFSSPLQRPKYEKLMRQYVRNNFTILSIAPLYKIFYCVKSSDIRLCNYFWDKSLNYILNGPGINKLQNMLNLSYKYINFSNNVGYRYRYYNFEKNVVEYFNNELNSNILALIPGKFSRIASFIIAYSTDYDYIEKLLDQLLEMSHRFHTFDYLNISKGLQSLIENREIRNNSNLANRVQLLNNTLNNCINQELNNNPTLPSVNMMLRSYILRKENTNGELFKKLLNYYVNKSNELTSHIIRDISFCLQNNNCLVPDVINKITEYIINKKENILGNTVDKVLYLCYSMGYTPENSDEFLDVASEIIIRDKDRYSGLSFLQSCLSLCYFHKLPNVLINRIFSVDFMEKLDEELSNCYAKTIYPSRVRDHLMQLNRAVCLDYPETDVPWFHQKYIEETKKLTPKNDFFHKEVLTVLKDLTNNTNNSIFEDTYTPYGYYLDFELKSSQNVAQNNLSKTAILLFNSKVFSNYKPNLKGYYQLKQRHLEILGYNVIGINYSEWKSFYTQQTCKEYIKTKLCPMYKTSVNICI